MNRPGTVEDYLDQLPEGARVVVDEIRRIAAETLPDSTESISYDMPTFSVEGRRIVHIGGWAQHVSLYPSPSGDDLQADMAPYLSGKGTLKFPLSSPIPYDLIARIIRSLGDEPH
jgi:uncharacterized protein YdhG (YjbR/CyaY superfamily)